MRNKIQREKERRSETPRSQDGSMLRTWDPNCGGRRMSRVARVRHVIFII